MRVAVPISLLFLLAMFLQPACLASTPIVPILTLTISPITQNVNSTTQNPVEAPFMGTASVQKLPVEKCVVTLTCSVDVGWVASVTPTQMVFTSSAPQQFKATVTVPQGTPSMAGNLTVSGRAVANGLQSVTHITALIDVNGSNVPYATASNRTAKHAASGTGASVNLGNSTIVTVSVTAVIIASIAVGGVVIYKKRKGGRMAASSGF